MQAASSLDSSGRLAADVVCVECGHTLRGLAADGACCECGQPVQLSLRGTRLANADPRWLKQVCGGIGALTMLLPWLWLPLVWPVVVAAGWNAAAPNPAAGAPTRRIAWIRRHGLLVALIVACFVTWFVGPLDGWHWRHYVTMLGAVTGVIGVWIASLTPGLSLQLGLVRQGRFLAWHAAAWCAGAIGLGWDISGTALIPAPSELAHILVHTVLVLVPASGLVVLPIALLRIWRALDTALTFARAYGNQSDVKVPPATASPLPATSPPASPPAGPGAA